MKVQHIPSICLLTLAIASLAYSYERYFDIGLTLGKNGYPYDQPSFTELVTSGLKPAILADLSGMSPPLEERETQLRYSFVIGSTCFLLGLATFAITAKNNRKQ